MNNLFFDSILILPGDEEYTETLSNIQLYWNLNKSVIDKENGDGCWVYGQDHLPRWVGLKDLEKYLGDGEYDQRIAQIEELEEFEPLIVEEILEPII